ncbi:MAG: hypothetical protein LUD79_02565 [Oscillospiraceae bacterium]|nr:hypothetical protein [Oscillospiraceae bacterium]
MVLKDAPLRKGDSATADCFERQKSVREKFFRKNEKQGLTSVQNGGKVVRLSQDSGRINL